jgi:AcrR family transcriptional regulator
VTGGVGYGEHVTESTDTFRDRKKLRTKQQLMNAAMELFSERGFDAVTVEEIAARAWVSERTFFRYFPSKEDVLWPDSEEQLAAFRAVIVGRPKKEKPLQAVRNAMLAMAAAVEIDTSFPLARARIVADTPGLIARDLLESSRWEDTVRGAIRERTGASEDDVIPAMIAVVAAGALRVAFERWVAAGASGDLQEMLSGAFDSLERAIRRG